MAFVRVRRWYIPTSFTQTSRGRLPPCLLKEIVRFWMAKGKVLAEMVDIGVMVADDKKQRVSHIIISKNKLLRLLIIKCHSNPYFFCGLFVDKNVCKFTTYF